MRMMDRRLVTHPSSEGPWKWHHHCIPRDRNDCHIWTCLLWRGRCGPITVGRATSPEACPGGDAPHAARQREQFHRGCPRGREGRMRRIPSRAGRLWGPIRVSSVVPLQRRRLGGGCSAAEWQWPHSTRVVSGGPGPRGRRGRAEDRGSRRHGSPRPSPDRRSGCISRSRSDRYSRATRRPPSEAEPAGSAITISG